MERATTKLRQLLKEKDFLYMPSAYYPLCALVAQQIGIESAYVGGYVTGGSKAVSEPLLSMDEQVSVAGKLRNDAQFLSSPMPALDLASLSIACVRCVNLLMRVLQAFI